MRREGSDIVREPESDEESLERRGVRVRDWAEERTPRMAPRSPDLTAERLRRMHVSGASTPASRKDDEALSKGTDRPVQESIAGVAPTEVTPDVSPVETAEEKSQSVAA